MMMEMMKGLAREWETLHETKAERAHYNAAHTTDTATPASSR